MIPLLLGLISLLVAPIADRLVRVGGGAEAWLEGFVLAVVVGAVVVLLLPEALGAAGITALVALALGLAAGVAVHHTLEARGNDLLWLVALLAHSLLDGGTIAADPHAHSLAGAVILHNVPVGLAVWRIASAEGGARIAGGVLLAMALATAVGFVLLDPATRALGEGSLLVLQCLFAGILLHPLAHLGRSRGPWGAGGVLVGVAALAWLAHGHAPPTGPVGDHLTFASTALVLVAWAGPALVLAAAGEAVGADAWTAPFPAVAVLLSLALLGAEPTLVWLVAGAVVHAVRARLGASAPPKVVPWDRTLAHVLIGVSVAACIEAAVDFSALPPGIGAALGGAAVAIFAAAGPGALPVLAVFAHERELSLGLFAAAPLIAGARGLPRWALVAAAIVAAPFLPPDLGADRLHGAAEGLAWWQALALAALGLLALRALARRGPATVLDSVLHPEEEPVRGS